MMGSRRSGFGEDSPTNSCAQDGLDAAVPNWR